MNLVRNFDSIRSVIIHFLICLSLYSGDADSDIKAEMEEPCDGQKSGIVSFPKFSSFEDILNVGWYKPQKQEIEILPDCY